jgi:quinoprotein glucose dehydrogenase
MSAADQPRRRPLVFPALIAPIGGFLLVVGLWLVALGGSPYYAVTGLAVLAAAWLSFRRDRRADAVYAATLAGTLAWAAAEAGLDGWALMPRLVGPAILGLLFLLPGMPRMGGTSVLRRTGWSAPMGVLTLLIFACGFLGADGSVASTGAGIIAGARVADSDWRHYGNAPGGTRYAALTQINAGNVAGLKPVWTHHSGEVPQPTSAYEATPLKVGDTLYTCTGDSRIIAIDARSGAERWRHDPQIRVDDYANRACRGVAYFDRGGRDGPCAKRIIAPTLDARLIAVDAATGRRCADFGTGGSVDLTAGLGSGFKPSQHYSTSPPVVIGSLAVIGGLVLDNQKVDMPSGVIRGFDAVTGRLVWAWDMGVPDRVGAPPAGERYTPGTPNAWAPLAADPALNLVYVPLGNPSPDFYGVRRRPFDERFGSSVVALDAANGRLRWSFQAVHHDLWDYDLPAQPTLIGLPIAGRMVPALVQPTKQGDLFVLDRRTGRPLLPVAERLAPKGGAIEPRLSRTQPSSVIDLKGPPLREASMWGITPLDQLICRLRFRQSRYEGRYTPPSTQYSLVYPGLTGVMNWGGISIDDRRKVAIVNGSYVPWRVRLVPRKQVTPEIAAAKWQPLMAGTPYAWEQELFLGPAGVPCNQPPWGLLHAVDLLSGKRLWSRRLGSGADSGPFGIRSRLTLPLGVPSIGGTVTTAGGISFVSGTLDQYVRAFDTRTGDELWRARLPFGGQATPMTYMAGGRQYLIVTAGGHAILGTRQGDAMIAYALERPLNQIKGRNQK